MTQVKINKHTRGRGLELALVIIALSILAAIGYQEWILSKWQLFQ